MFYDKLFGARKTDGKMIKLFPWLGLEPWWPHVAGRVILEHSSHSVTELNGDNHNICWLFNLIHPPPPNLVLQCYTIRVSILSSFPFYRCLNIFLSGIACKQFIVFLVPLNIEKLSNFSELNLVIWRHQPWCSHFYTKCHESHPLFITHNWILSQIRGHWIFCPMKFNE